MNRLRYLWRLHLGWFPVQPCLGCDRWYWGGLPQFEFHNGRLELIWKAVYMDYCSKQCNDWNEWGEGTPRT